MDERQKFLPERSSNDEKQHKTATQRVWFTIFDSLISLLPAGTFFLFQFLNPIATNYGHCTRLHKYLSAALLIVCSLSCIFASFTDSYIGSDGRSYYGIVTREGLWPAPFSDPEKLWLLRLRGRDFVQAALSLLVFGVLGFLDMNTVRCLYPVVGAYDDVLYKMATPLVGVICGTVCLIFPWKRNGIGYSVR